MSGAVADRKRLIRVTRANLRYGHLYVTGHYDFFPPDIIGSNLKSDPGVPVTIELAGLGTTIQTDIATEKDGTPRRHFRELKAFPLFFKHHNIQPGDELTLERLDKRSYRLHPPREKFTFVDLFAGIGGMRLGFQAVGGLCVFTSEWNKFAQKTYKANFGHSHAIAGDITKVVVEDVPAHDVLLAGFPCQPFSIAGVSKKNALGRPHGFLCDTQGTLFFDVARIINYHRPKAFLLENVKNLVGHDKGRTFAVIRRTLEDLGYAIDFRVIDAKPFVPQHRERIFIVGFRDDVGFSFDDVEIPATNRRPTLRAVLHPEDGSEPPEPPYTVAASGKVAPKYTLTQHLWGYLQDYAAKHQARGNGFGFGLFGPDDVARTLSARYYKDGSEILIRQQRTRPRRLTPRECARLMGFDRAGQSPFIIPVSDTQAYKQFGNSVVVPVVEAIAMAMAPYIASEQPVPHRRSSYLFEPIRARSLVAING